MSAPNFLLLAGYFPLKLYWNFKGKKKLSFPRTAPSVFVPC